jgi:hypothetical protein
MTAKLYIGGYDVVGEINEDCGHACLHYTPQGGFHA